MCTHLRETSRSQQKPAEFLKKEKKKKSAKGQRQRKQKSAKSCLPGGRHPRFLVSSLGSCKKQAPSLPPPSWRCRRLLGVLLGHEESSSFRGPQRDARQKRDPIKVGPSLTQNIGFMGEAVTLPSSCKIIKETVLRRKGHSWLSENQK